MKRFLLVVVVLSLLMLAGCSGGANSKKTSNLTVTVLDNENKPISGATIGLDGKTGSTDSNGKYTFKSLEEGSFTVNVSKEGYEDNSDSIDVTAGKDAALTITLSKKTSEQVSELKELSSIKSYAFTFVTKDEEGKTSTIKEELNDFGKREHLIVINENGEVETEYFLVNDKAKMKSGDEWMEFTGEQATNMGGMFSSLAESFSNNAISWYNEAVRVPGGSVTFKRFGNETVNGYPTTKYEYTITGEKYLGGDYEKVVVNYWVINSGNYKDYTTRLIFEYTPTKNSTGNYQSIEFNFTRLGEDIKIELP